MSSIQPAQKLFVPLCVKNFAPRRPTAITLAKLAPHYRTPLHSQYSHAHYARPRGDAARWGHRALPPLHPQNSCVKFAPPFSTRHCPWWLTAVRARLAPTPTPAFPLVPLRGDGGFVIFATMNTSWPPSLPIPPERAIHDCRLICHSDRIAI